MYVNDYLNQKNMIEYIRENEYSIYYILLCIIFFFIIVYLFQVAYFSFSHRFWSKQPIYPKYNKWIYSLYLLFWNNGWIKTNNIKNNDYTRTDICKTIRFNDLVDEQKNFIVELVRENYLQEQNEKYEAEINNIFSSIDFDTKQYPSYITFVEDKLNKENDNKIIGCILSNTMNIKLGNHSQTIHYVDHLCVDKKFRNKPTSIDLDNKIKIAPTLINTHSYSILNNISQHSLEHPKIFCFKRESHNSFIQPLVKCNNYIFDIKPINMIRDYLTYFNLELVEITKSNIYILSQILNKEHRKSLHHYFRNSLYPHISQIHNLLNENILKIFVIKSKNEIYGLYIFKDNNYYYNDKPVIELKSSCCFTRENDWVNNKISQMKNDNLTYRQIDKMKKFLNELKLNIENIFITSIYLIINQIGENNKKVFEYLSIENISHNPKIISFINHRQKYLHKLDNHYFLYNYIYGSIKPNNFFVIE